MSVVVAGEDVSQPSSRVFSSFPSSFPSAIPFSTGEEAVEEKGRPEETGGASLLMLLLPLLPLLLLPSTLLLLLLLPQRVVESVPPSFPPPSLPSLSSWLRRRSRRPNVFASAAEVASEAGGEGEDKDEEGREAWRGEELASNTARSCCASFSCRPTVCLMRATSSAITSSAMLPPFIVAAAATSRPSLPLLATRPSCPTPPMTCKARHTRLVIW